MIPLGSHGWMVGSWRMCIDGVAYEDTHTHTQTHTYIYKNIHMFPFQGHIISYHNIYIYSHGFGWHEECGHYAFKIRQDNAWQSSKWRSSSICACTDWWTNVCLKSFYRWYVYSTPGCNVHLAELCVFPPGCSVIDRRQCCVTTTASSQGMPFVSAAWQLESSIVMVGTFFFFLRVWALHSGTKITQLPKLYPNYTQI